MREHNMRFVVNIDVLTTNNCLLVTLNTVRLRCFGCGQPDNILELYSAIWMILEISAFGDGAYTPCCHGVFTRLGGKF